jgi:hypothetical protein
MECLNEHLSEFRLLDLPSTIRPVWKGVSINNTLAYYGMESKNSFPRFSPGPNVIKLFMSVTYECS